MDCDLNYSDELKGGIIGGKTCETNTNDKDSSEETKIQCLTAGVCWGQKNHPRRQTAGSKCNLEKIR